MPARSIFRWRDGRGWLILSGGPTPEDDIRALALALSAADGAVAYVTTAAGDGAQRALDDMVELGAPSGYLVDVMSEDDPTVRARLADAGMVLVESGASADESRSALLGAAVDGIEEAFANGAVILAEGPSAMVFGAWVVRADGSLAAGLDWLEGGLVAPGVLDAAAWGHDLLLAQPLAFVVGIGAGSALAFGPDGQVEVWGRGQITVALGRDFTSSPRTE